LSAYLDGELSSGDAAALEHHLQGCPNCRAELTALGRIRQLLRHLPPPDPPIGLVELLLIRPRRRVLPVAWAASAAAAIALGALAAGTTTSRPPTVAHLVQVHATSTGRDPVSGLAPVAVPVSFGP
jgi:predicted anti-sigma-YlaC factor YlaD